MKTSTVRIGIILPKGNMAAFTRLYPLKCVIPNLAVLLLGIHPEGKMGDAV